MARHKTKKTGANFRKNLSAVKYGNSSTMKKKAARKPEKTGSVPSAPDDFARAQPPAYKPTIELPKQAADAVEAKKGLPHAATAIVSSAILTAIFSFAFLFIFQIGAIYTFGLSAAIFVGLSILIYSAIEKS